MEIAKAPRNGHEDSLDPASGSAPDKKGNFFSRVKNKLTGVVGGMGPVAGEAGKPVELSRYGAEALITNMSHVLEHTKPFGKSVADFALHGTATRGLSMGSRELAKGIVSWSGLAGAVGGGVTGTIVAGAFVGAVSGALVEYARQVNRNLDRKAEADPSLAGRKAAFLLKFKELRHGGVLKPTDLKKIRNAAIFGAIAGAGAGALVEHIPQLAEFVREHTGGLSSVFSGNISGVEGVKDIAGGAKDLTGGAWHGAGEMVDNAKDMAGTAPGVEGIKGALGGAKDFAGTIPGVQGVENLAGGAKDMAGNLPGVHGVGDAVGGVWHGVGEMVDNAKHAVDLGGVHETGQQAVQAPPEGFVPQVDFNALQDQVTHQAQDLTQTHQQIDDLQRQLDALKHASGIAGAVVPPADAVTAAVVDQAHTALNQFGDSIPLSAGSNPWQVSTTILRQMGVNPTPEQIMQLDKVLSQENGISVPEWGIKGTIDANNLPVGFKLNLTDIVKKTALAIASKK